ncbi:MAG TPA: bifunctional acetate--CoA ligase family protein/GNAT family N-acetyltransferase [Caulobacteraceae bacterium]|nr:bifunctional acetate--CoA ligase family protein/GNAT family N-acetyltransferase [Caulobacteraceae bacterium]
MSTRNLDALFRPKTIALVGASNREGAVGWAIARNLYAAGFAGPILAVSPHEPAIGSVLSYRSVGELPLTPDLAVLATPAAAAPELIAELGQRGCRAAIVVAAGLGEGEERAGSDLRQAMLDAARPHMLRIVGPNCLGFLSPGAGINASFAHLAPRSGDVAFVAQSGALVTAVLDWAVGRDLGFSHIASLGDMADVDFGDMLDWLALDTATRSILLYVESVTQARKFMSAARIAARAKPVIVIKSGRSAAGAKAALSHTGALAGSDAVYDAAFRRAGMLRVESLHELFEAAETLASRLTVRGDRLAILTNGGGAGVLATDALEALGGRLAELAPDVRAKLDGILPTAWSHGVPVDILGDADGDRYAAALGALEANPDQDAILVMNCPTAVVDNARVVDALVTAAAAPRHRPLLTCWLGEATASAARRRFAAAGVPTYETPDDAVRAFMQLDQYRRNQALLMETPPAGPEIDGDGRTRARALVDSALAAGRGVLTEPEAKTLLAAYGVPIVASETAASPADAAQAAAKIGFPVVLKILSPDISHKSDVGGVRLGLGSSEAVEAAATAMLKSVAASAPGAAIEGFTVESMIERPQARELICGIVADATFGPAILVGQGGVAVEVVGDRALGLPPLNAVLARDMIRRTRVAKLLDAYRNVAAVDHAALEDVLVRLSAIAVDLPEVVELDINPLLADAEGMLAVDARVVLKPVAADAASTLAIQPYPSGLDRTITLESGQTFRLRPVRPDDAPALIELSAHCDPADLRLRFFGAMTELSPRLAARLSQIDYDREMALLAIPTAPDGISTVAGVVRLSGDPDRIEAEYAISVRSDLKHRGLGRQLMREILAYARSRGYVRVFGQVLAENTTMLDLARQLGATVSLDPADCAHSRVVFDLENEAPVAG